MKRGDGVDCRTLVCPAMRELLKFGGLQCVSYMP